MNSVQDKSAQAMETRLAQAIDHTKLTFADGENETAAIEQLCAEARQYQFCAVCVRPRHIAQAKSLLLGSPVKVATVIGFPLHKVKLADELQHPTVGHFSTDEKVAETRLAVSAGADELDVVINVAQLKKDLQAGTRAVAEELTAIRDAAEGRMIKVIIETDLLNSTEIEQITRWCVDIGMGMVKTSTGMVDGGRGATPEAVALIAQTLQKLNAKTGIKASGGIKTKSQAIAYLEAGVNRLGTSSGISILQEKAVAADAY